MSYPLVPFAATNAIGWAAIGVAGVVTYKVGKKAGLKHPDGTDESIETPGLGDRALKGAMKAFYRTRKKVGAVFSKSGDRVTTLWEEVKAEEAVRADASA